MKTTIFFAAVIIMIASVSLLGAATTGGSFGDDVAFLQKYNDTIVLSDQEGSAKIAVVPAWQGRVMTSTSGGDAGASYGWINRELISSKKLAQHINVFGGEDRFWLGPEGGQFSIFFAKGASFDLDHWFTPAAIDSLAYAVTNQTATSIRFGAEFPLTNYSGTTFNVKVDREIKLLGPAAAWKKLGLKPAPGIKLVAFETDNQITNTGKAAWTPAGGLLSVWILGQFNPSPATTIVVPIKAGPDAKLGVKVTSDYFGPIPPERLVVKDNVVFFSGDGRYRSKIGINPKRSRGVLGSYDADNQVLTIIIFSQPAGVTDYVNSLWKLQDNPFGGDAANSYNDGPPAPGAKPLGPFFELESSSPAAALAPGKSLTHVHTTMHLSGSDAALDATAKAVLGVSLAEIKAALPK